MLKVDHIITGLSGGGAEHLLVRLLPRWARLGIRSRVLSLRAGGVLEDEVRAAGVDVFSADLRRSPSAGRALFWARRWLAEEPAAVVQTWLYHGNVLGGLLARSLGRTPVVWGLHTSSLDPRFVRSSTRVLARAGAPLSYLVPARIVCCSEQALVWHRRAGYRDVLMLRIDNGVDTDVFAPQPGAGAALRRELGLDAGCPLIGMVARFHPSKDHATFLAAAARFAAVEARAHFVLAGVPPDNQDFAAAAAPHPTLRGRLHALGHRRDIAHVHAALDVFTLTSRTEASPLAVLEAMASGSSIVVTAGTGAAGWLGEDGRVVDTGDATALAAAWRAALADPPDRRAHAARALRARVQNDFSLEVTARRYADLYAELASARSSAR